MKNITKKDAKKFNQEVVKMILENGFQKTDMDIFEEFEKTTKLGKINISLYSLDKTPIYSIFGRFDEPKKAAKVFDCNPFSGKYNIHTYEMVDAIDQLDFLLFNLDNNTIECGIRNLENETH